MISVDGTRQVDLSLCIVCRKSFSKVRNHVQSVNVAREIDKFTIFFVYPFLKDIYPSQKGARVYMCYACFNPIKKLARRNYKGKHCLRPAQVESWKKRGVVGLSEILMTKYGAGHVDIEVIKALCLIKAFCFCTVSSAGAACAAACGIPCHPHINETASPIYSVFQILITAISS